MSQLEVVFTITPITANGDTAPSRRFTLDVDSENFKPISSVKFYGMIRDVKNAFPELKSTSCVGVLFVAENGFKILLQNFSVDICYILNLYKGKIVNGSPSIPLWIVNLPLSPKCLDEIVSQCVNNVPLLSMKTDEQVMEKDENLLDLVKELTSKMDHLMAADRLSEIAVQGFRTAGRSQEDAIREIVREELTKLLEQKKTESKRSVATSTCGPPEISAQTKKNVAHAEYLLKLLANQSVNLQKSTYLSASQPNIAFENAQTPPLEQEFETERPFSVKSSYSDLANHPIPLDWLRSQSLAFFENASTAPRNSNPAVTQTLEKMLAMGFKDDGGWLTRFLEKKGGNIDGILKLFNLYP